MVCPHEAAETRLVPPRVEVGFDNFVDAFDVVASKCFDKPSDFPEVCWSQEIVKLRVEVHLHSDARRATTVGDSYLRPRTHNSITLADGHCVLISIGWLRQQLHTQNPPITVRKAKMACAAVGSDAVTGFHVKS